MAGQYNAMLKSRSNHYPLELFEGSSGFNYLTMPLKANSWLLPVANY